MTEIFILNEAVRALIKPLFIAAVILSSGCGPGETGPGAVLPTPRATDTSRGHSSFAEGFTVMTEAPELEKMAGLLADDLYLLTGIDNATTGKLTSLQLLIDSDMAKEAYRLSVDESVVVAGGSFGAVSMGVVTLLQSLDDDLQLPRMEVLDEPELPYRGVMIDLSRAWHDVSTLKEIIQLCRWYKINYLHLHLTDDQSFTFPSTAYPELATEGRSYTLAQLRELNEYAFERGVTLVPEIDVPGHSTQFVGKLPETFGLADPSRNSFTITMGREETYRALSILVGEVAEVFSHSPYIHIGGDEAFFAGMDEDPETLAYMAANELPNLDELFRHFLVRMNEMVRSYGKETIVWAGFGEEGVIEIPRDIIVMHWESQYYDPQRLINDGFQVINASFKPLYVVNNRKWDPDYIYDQWNVFRWESWATPPTEFMGSEIRPSDLILGGSMSAWEQDQTNQVSRLRLRLPAMGEHLWNPFPPPLSQFSEALGRTDASFGRLLRPFVVREEGMTFPEVEEGLFLEHRWFQSSVRLDAEASYDGLILRYTLDGSEVTPDSEVFTGPLTINRSLTAIIQAFNAGNDPIGLPYRQRYQFRPLSARVEGLWEELPTGSWEKVRFEVEMSFHFETAFADHDIRYTLDGSAPTVSSPTYDGPITIRETTTVRGRLFDAMGEAVGMPFRETYYQIVNQPSLTTGKPTWATNDDIRPGLASRATNGRITLWEQWGGHVGDEVWVTVDLEAPEVVSRIQVYNFWDGYRYYQYTVDGSLDGDNWSELVDFSGNVTTASMEGYTHTLAPTEVRYLRINLLYNSANPGLHLVEFSAFH